MLDEAVKGKHGGDRGNQYTGGKMDIVHLDNHQGGNSRAAGLRKLRKYAEEKPEVAEVYEKVLSGEISVNKALLETGLRKAPAKATSTNASVEEVATIINGWSLSKRRRLVRLISENLSAYGI